MSMFLKSRIMALPNNNNRRVRAIHVCPEIADDDIETCSRVQ